MRKLGLGQVGVGKWGQFMVTTWNAHERAAVLAVCDRDGDVARAVAKKLGVPAYYDNLEDFLRHPGLEAVGVATPDCDHCTPVVRALESGKHVIVQKPMATNVEDCRAMLAAQEKSGCHLMVDFQHRWGIGPAEARRLIANAAFGRVVHGHIRMSNTQRAPLENIKWSHRSSVLWFLGTHTADLARYLVGSEVERVYAVARRTLLKSRGVDTPDFFQSILEFENGAVIQMENSWVLPKGDAFGVEMNLSLYGENECVRVNQSPSNVITRTTDSGVEWPISARGIVTGRGISLRHFVDSVLAGRAPAVTGHDGLMNTAVLAAIERSAAEGRAVWLREVL